jgi:hypothetical protein
MATKNSAAEVRAEGFVYSQFGHADDTAFDAAIDDILTEVTEVVKERVGATNYAASGDAVANHVKRAERFLACAGLCRQRLNRIDADTVVGGDDSALAALLRELRIARSDYLAEAEKELAAVPSSTSASDSSSSAPAFGAAVSSHFAEAST